MLTIPPLTVHAVVVAQLTHVLAGSNDKAHHAVGLFMSQYISPRSTPLFKYQGFLLSNVRLCFYLSRIFKSITIWKFFGLWWAL
ncbi:hypothetical protein SL38_04545 [Klebsiella pneumoniae]|nr:hypothetical protein KPH11_09205 [Klebsiella pneumoniae subsp. pneumoniae]KMA42768.1 hypothetical protein SL38_04545 [Klebsiella pneumoniae]